MNSILDYVRTDSEGNLVHFLCQEDAIKYETQMIDGIITMNYESERIINLKNNE